MVADGLTATERRLLERLQDEFPLAEEPYRRLGDELGLSAEEVLSLTTELCRRGVIRRLGPVYEARALGYVSTLLAIEVADEAFEEVTRQVNAFPEVTHNYERQHQLNCWCTVLAATDQRLREVVEAIKHMAGVLRVLELPVRRRYKLRLAFSFSEVGEADDAG